jgi:hypothetical protein
MTSTTAMESKQMVGSQTDDKLHRGRNVVLAFLMQGELLYVSLGCFRDTAADEQAGASFSIKRS